MDRKIVLVLRSRPRPATIWPALQIGNTSSTTFQGEQTLFRFAHILANDDAIHEYSTQRFLFTLKITFSGYLCGSLSLAVYFLPANIDSPRACICVLWDRQYSPFERVLVIFVLGMRLLCIYSWLGWVLFTAGGAGRSTIQPE